MTISNMSLRRGIKALLFFYASLAYSAQITDLLKSSDVVVIGAPTSFTNRADGTLINLSIIQWLSPASSGTPASVQVLATLLPSEQHSVIPAAPEKSVPGIWFLKSQSDGTYTPQSVNRVLNFFIAADRGACPGSLTYPPDAPLTDKIALELACAASKESGPPGAFSGSMVAATYGLGISQRVHDAFMYLAQLPGSRQKAIGIACLIGAKDLMGLALLEQHVQELTDYELQVIVGTTILSWRNTDPIAIGSLGRIVTGSRGTGAFLKYAGVALREIHTADTLPYLRLLLDNPDRNARKDAIGGFVSFIMGYPVHTPENHLTMEFMKASPTPYSTDTAWRQFAISADPSDAQLQAAVTFWKQWLNSHPELPQ